ncbi:PKD domain-containing protein [Flavobacterium sp. N1736]|uniref:PKD domain-containing protein n=1 Tax=Flavobacterium sp. N1736 TaxID=2986823 RepID=UPI0022245215|nr:PKD domain-containing protein [Flavobacterium sp. N1736]
MKKIHSIISLFVLALFFSCSSDENSDIDLEGLSAPTNISALTTVTQDNTGKVTFLPNGEGVTQYKIDFGDGSAQSDYFSTGANVAHNYKEGVYHAKIIAMGLNGKTTQVDQEVVVSFKAPQNLVVEVTNDLSVSKKITVKATADFALFYDVYFGETGKPNPVSANNGESISYTYQEAGVYTIRVVSKSAAIQTTEKTLQVTAKLVLNPTTSAPAPPNRQAGDVISIYGSKYTNVAGTNYFPDWGQAGQGSSWTEFDLNGDKMLNYIKLSYQGIALADNVTIDVSGMEYLHMDVWTADLQKIETSLISKTNGEKPVVKDLTANQWTSIDIPISAFTSQGLTVADIFQLKLVGTPWAGGTVFVDNIYFYKTASQAIQLPLDFESASLTYTWGGFGNVDASIIANPNKTGINVSDKVLKLDKKAGAEVWGGASLNLENTLDYTKGTTVKVNVWSPKVGADILYKMELSTSPKDGNNNPTVFIEVHAATTVANAWQVLTFDLTSAAGFSTSIKYDRVILFPDFGQMGTGSTYYFDDIKQSN